MLKELEKRLENAKSEGSYLKKHEHSNQLYKVMLELKMEDPRTLDAAGNCKSQSIALLALGEKPNKYLRDDERASSVIGDKLATAVESELKSIRNADRVSMGNIAGAHKGSSNASAPAPSPSAPEALMGGPATFGSVLPFPPPSPGTGLFSSGMPYPGPPSVSASGSGKGVPSSPSNTASKTPRSAGPRTTKLAAVGLTLAYNKDPMDLPIVKVITGERPDMARAHGTVTTKEGEDLRHVVAYDLIAKALRVCLKGLTPNQVALWLEQERAWLDNKNRDADIKPLLDNLGVSGVNCHGTILRTVGAVQHAVDAWLKNAINYTENLFAGKASINRSKGSTMTSTKHALKQTWRRYICPIDQVGSIACVDQQRDTNVDFCVLTLSAATSGKKGYIASKVGEAYVSAGTEYKPDKALGNRLLFGPPGAKFKITKGPPLGPIPAPTMPPQLVGALLIDQNGRLFQVSREFSLIDKANKTYNPKPFSYSLKHHGAANESELAFKYLKSAIDPKSLKGRMIEKITPTDGIAIRDALTSLKMWVPKWNPGQPKVNLEECPLVEVALGDDGKLPTKESLTLTNTIEPSKTRPSHKNATGPKPAHDKKEKKTSSSTLPLPQPTKVVRNLPRDLAEMPSLKKAKHSHVPTTDGDSPMGDP